jgi:tetratricopeptide (TPR) repeat protein
MLLVLSLIRNAIFQTHMNNSLTLTRTLPLQILMVILMLAPGFLAAQGPGKRAYLMGENYRKQNRCKDAVLQYDEAIRLEPANYKYYFQRGKCQYNLKDYAAAKESFKSTVEFKPNFTPAYSLLAKIYKNEKDYDNAIYYYQEAARFESNNNRKVQYELLLVNLLLKEDRVSEAARHIEDARKIDPTNPNILFYNAEIQAMRKNWTAAKADYEKALASERLKSASPAQKAKYYYGLGVALNNLGDNAGAKAAWGKANFGRYKQLIAQQMRENNHVYFYKIAVSYYLNGEYQECETYLAKALEIQRDFASAYILKGKIARKQGSVTQAINYYQQAVAMENNPSRKASMYRLVAAMQMERNDYSSALTTIDKALKTDVKIAASLMGMKGQAEYRSGRYNESIATIEELLRAGIDTKAKAKYSFMLGMAAKKVRDNDKARAAFKDAMYGPYKPAAKIELDKLAQKG